MSETTSTEALGQSQEPQAQEPQVQTVPEVLPNWAERRLAEMRRKLGDEERARALAEARLKDLETRAPASGEPAQTTTSAAGISEAQLEARAMELASRMQFTEQCNDIARQGNAKFDDFADVMGNFGKYLGDIPRTIVEGALETDDPAGTIYALGKDMAEATRIAGLSAGRQAAAVVRFALKQVPAPQMPSAQNAKSQVPAAKAPPPIVPRVGSGAAAKTAPTRLDDDNSSLEDWMTARRESLRRT